MKKITFIACFVLAFSMFSNSQGYEKGKIFAGPTFAVSRWGGIGSWTDG